MFTSGIVSVVNGHPIALFFTGRKHAGENSPMSWPDARSNWAPPFNVATPVAEIPHLRCAPSWPNCLSHARRRYVDVVARTLPEECRFASETLREVYHNDQLGSAARTVCRRSPGFSPGESRAQKSLEDLDDKAQFEDPRKDRRILASAKPSQLHAEALASS